jgi:hypothetical protein
MKKFVVFVAVSIAKMAVAQLPLSLHDAQQRALQYNYEVQMVRNSTNASRIENTYGNAGGLPSVDLNLRDQESLTDIDQKFSNGTEISRNGNASNNFNGQALVNYTLFNGFRIRATRDRLNALENAGEQNLLAQFQNTLAAVTVKYFDIVRQQRYKSALIRSKEFADQKLNIIDQRVKLGLSNDADLFQARIDANTADQNLAEQDLLIRRAIVDLNTIMVVDLDTLYQLTDSMIIDREIILDSVLQFVYKNPELQASLSLAKASDQIIQEIQSERLPSLRLDGGYSYNRTVNQAGFSLFNLSNGPVIGATLQIPIYSGGTIRSQEKIASLNADNARLEAAVTGQRLQAQAIKSFEAYQTALGQLEQQEESFDLASRVLDIQLERFSVGASTILDLRAAQASFEQAAGSLVNARYIAKLSETELKRLMCRLGN